MVDLLVKLFDLAANVDVAKKKPQKKSAGDDDFLSGLDFSRAESEDEKVCPFCAAETPPRACPRATR